MTTVQISTDEQNCLQNLTSENRQTLGLEQARGGRGRGEEVQFHRELPSHTNLQYRRQSHSRNFAK